MAFLYLLKLWSSLNTKLKLGIDVICLFGNITLYVSLSKKNCKICSIYNNIINIQSFIYSSKLMTTIFRCDAQNVVLSFFKLIIGLMYLKRKATLWLYSNFIVILYTNVSIMYRRPCLWSYKNNVSSGVARGGWVFNNENFVWQVCKFEWNDQFQGYISAELPRAKLLWWT